MSDTIDIIISEGLAIGKGKVHLKLFNLLSWSSFYPDNPGPDKKPII